MIVQDLSVIEYCSTLGSNIIIAQGVLKYVISLCCTFLHHLGHGQQLNVGVYLPSSKVVTLCVVKYGPVPITVIEAIAAR